MPLPLAQDWRWLLGRDDSPWYPTMRLFRQTRPGEWRDVFDRIARALRERVAGPARATAAPVRVEVPVGELFDKITILELKAERFTDPAKLANVRAELAALTAARDLAVPAADGLAGLTAELRAINATLWAAEDKVWRVRGAAGLRPAVRRVSRSIYRTNLRRSEVKRLINELLGSRLVEEKDYEALALLPRPRNRHDRAIYRGGGRSRVGKAGKRGKPR